MNNHYNKNLKKYARKLRNESVSKAEKFLWRKVLSRNQIGVKFKRQRPILNFIVDFFSQEIGLIIEIDGSSHFAKNQYDFYREEKLKSVGFTIIRFSERDVLCNIGEVIVQIEQALLSLKSSAR